MESKIKVAGHPLHPMLVTFPVAFYTAALVCYVVYEYNVDPFWFNMGFCANIAGVGTAILAAIPGIVDRYTLTEEDSLARETSTTHAALNVAALAFFGLNAWLQAGEFRQPLPVGQWSIFLATAGVVCTVFAGFQGWTLVQRFKVGLPSEPAVPINMPEKRSTYSDPQRPTG